MSHLFQPETRSLRPLRFYQEHCIPRFRQAIHEGHLHSIGQAPCRYGKTVVSAHIIDNALRKGSRCLFAAPRIALVEQTLESFEQQGLRGIGVMQANHPRCLLYTSQVKEGNRKKDNSEEFPSIHFIDIQEVISITDPVTGEFTEYVKGQPVVQGEKQ